MSAHERVRIVDVEDDGRQSTDIVRGRLARPPRLSRIRVMPVERMPDAPRVTRSLRTPQVGKRRITRPACGAEEVERRRIRPLAAVVQKRIGLRVPR